MLGAPSHVDPLIGRLIDGKFEVESLIGAGGMGAVYRAKQTNLKRAVAIKVLRRELLDDPTFAARFKREANAASQLDHPNLMRVIDFGEDENLLYIAMELIDGKPLSHVLRDEFPLESARIVDLVSQLLAGLAAMHDERIIHRDLKPENVMVVRGKTDDGHVGEVVKLCDFGIAKQVALPNRDPALAGATQTATLTVAGSLVGTPDYMSPEQAKGDPLDGRSDVYSVGVILYQLLAGRLPFQSSNSVKLLLAHINEKPVPPSKHEPTVNNELEDICLRALAKDRAQRFESAREMRLALREGVGLRDSAVLGARLAAARASIPPPAAAPNIVDKPAEVPARRAPDPLPTTGTVASGASVVVPSSPPSPPPPPAVVSTTPPAASNNKTNPMLIGLIVVLLLVIVFLVVRK